MDAHREVVKRESLGKEYVEQRRGKRPMRYPDGQEVRLGDKVRLWPGADGMVVCSLDTQEYSVAYPAADWSYLKNGVLIRSHATGLVHYLEPESSFELIERGQSP
jgi:hypothetical protein